MCTRLHLSSPVLGAGERAECLRTLAAPAENPSSVPQFQPATLSSSQPPVNSSPGDSMSSSGPRGHLHRCACAHKPLKFPDSSVFYPETFSEHDALVFWKSQDPELPSGCDCVLSHRTPTPCTHIPIHRAAHLSVSSGPHGGGGQF